MKHQQRRQRQRRKVIFMKQQQQRRTNSKSKEELTEMDKKLDDQKKNVFELISEICESDKINDAEWVKKQLLKTAPPPKPERALMKLPCQNIREFLYSD